jgi:hypothetical protein
MTEDGLLVFENPDKLVNRSSGVQPYMPMWPFRLLAAGPPNSGKRGIILNVIVRLHPPPSAIHIVHIDPHTTEYDVLRDIGCPMYFYGVDDFVTIGNLEDPGMPEKIGDVEVTPKIAEQIDTLMFGTDPVVIVDEITRDMLKGDNLVRFDRLMNYGSSHKNTSVLCSIQVLSNLPPKCRRAFNQYVLWKQSDHMANVDAATKAGIPVPDLLDMFGLCTDRHDSIWVDAERPPGDPWKFRLNMINPITDKIDEVICEEE